MKHTHTTPDTPAPGSRPQSPTAHQVKAAREAAGQTTASAAALVYMDVRSWRYYEAGQRAMHPAMWELYRIKCAQNPTNG